MVNRTEYHRKYYRKNALKLNERQRRWCKENPVRYRQRHRRYLVSKYGLTLEDFDALIKGQGGKCAICPKLLDISSADVHIDHDHKTGRVRGVLCKNCNTGLGNFFDDVDVLQKALDYLKK